VNNKTYYFLPFFGLMWASTPTPFLEHFSLEPAGILGFPAPVNISKNACEPRHFCAAVNIANVKKQVLACFYYSSFKCSFIIYTGLFFTSIYIFAKYSPKTPKQKSCSPPNISTNTARVA